MSQINEILKKRKFIFTFNLLLYNNYKEKIN